MSAYVLFYLSMIFLGTKSTAILKRYGRTGLDPFLGFILLIVPLFNYLAAMFLGFKSYRMIKAPSDSVVITENVLIKRSVPQNVAFYVLNTLRIVLTAFLPLIIVLSMAENFLKKEVDRNAIPGRFPVVVFTSKDAGKHYQANIVINAELAEFLKKSPDYTYLVPAIEDEKFSALFIEQIPNEVGYWYRVEKGGKDRQSLIVSAIPYSADGKNIGWYEATDKEIFPKYHSNYFEPAVFMGPGLFPLLLMTFLIWWFFGFFIRKLGLVRYAIHEKKIVSEVVSEQSSTGNLAQALPAKNHQLKRFFKIAIFVIVGAFMALVLLTKFVMRLSKVIYPSGRIERGILYKLDYKFHKPAIGDQVIFIVPQEGERSLAGFVAGLPEQGLIVDGQTVMGTDLVTVKRGEKEYVVPLKDIEGRFSPFASDGVNGKEEKKK